VDRVRNRRSFLIAIGVGALVRGVPSAAQQRRRVARLGWLSVLAPPDPDLEAFREGLRELGYLETSHYLVVPRYAEGDPRKLPDLLADLVRENVDIIVARGTAVFAAKAASPAVPILFGLSGDPVEAGLVESLARPGRNTSGITFLALDLAAKRVELLKEIAPRAVRIAVLTNPDHAGERNEHRMTQESAQRLGAVTVRHVVQTPEQIAGAFEAIRASRPDALVVFPDQLTARHSKVITDFALRERLPSIYGWSTFTEAGGLVSYGPNLREQYRRLATFADKVMRGVDAGSIPVELPRTFELQVNLATAKAIGVTIPQAVLQRADRIIE
jgi:putative tryptophan/tyrosine transport system substrate-binding protein